MMSFVSNLIISTAKYSIHSFPQLSRLRVCRCDSIPLRTFVSRPDENDTKRPRMKSEDSHFNPCYTFANTTVKTCFVNDDRSLVIMRRLLNPESTLLIALDIEIKPNFFEGDPEQPPSILQIAARDIGSDDVNVFIVDLLCMLPSRSQELDKILIPLFLEPHCLVVGMAIEQDVRKLCRHYPSSKCFRLARNSVDLGRTSARGPRQGLKALTEQYLQESMSKHTALSNWARRPLEERQLLYASKDAAACLLIYQREGPQVFTNLRDVNGAVYYSHQCSICQIDFPSRTKLVKYCKKNCDLSSPKSLAPNSILIERHIEYEGE